MRVSGLGWPVGDPLERVVDGVEGPDRPPAPPPAAVTRWARREAERARPRVPRAVHVGAGAVHLFAHHPARLVPVTPPAAALVLDQGAEVGGDEVAAAVRARAPCSRVGADAVRLEGDVGRPTERGARLPAAALEPGAEERPRPLRFRAVHHAQVAPQEQALLRRALRRGRPGPGCPRFWVSPEAEVDYPVAIQDAVANAEHELKRRAHICWPVRPGPSPELAADQRLVEGQALCDLLDDCAVDGHMHLRGNVCKLRGQLEPLWLRELGRIAARRGCSDALGALATLAQRAWLCLFRRRRHPGFGGQRRFCHESRALLPSMVP